MPRKNSMNQWQEPSIGLDIPRLPFLTKDTPTPACTEYADTFARAGDLDRMAVSTPAARRRHERSERLARAICAACPVLLGCRRYALETRQRWGVWGGTNALEREEWTRIHPPTKEAAVAETPDDIPTIPLFDAEAMRVTPARTRSARSVAQGNCPNCLKGKVGVLPSGDHWVWRTHYFKTWGGDTRLCATSGVSVCVAPEPAGKPLAVGKPITCPHGPGPLHLDAA